MDINKWFNKQKPITLAFITSITSFIGCYLLSYFTEINFSHIDIFKFCSASVMMFFFSWLLFSMGESSSKVFKEIEDLYFRAKKVKTKGDLIVLESDYRILRKKCQHQNHYSEMNQIWQIVETKKEFLQYLQEARIQFVRHIASIPCNTKLRAEVDSLLIAYDQMYYKLDLEEKKNQ